MGHKLQTQQEQPCTAENNSKQVASGEMNRVVHTKKRVNEVDLRSVQKCDPAMIVASVGGIKSFGSWFVCPVPLLTAAPAAYLCLLTDVAPESIAVLKQENGKYAMHSIPDGVLHDPDRLKLLQKWCVEREIDVIMNAPEMEVGMDGWKSQGLVTEHKSQLFYSVRLLTSPSRSSLYFMKRAVQQFADWQVNVVDELQGLAGPLLMQLRQIKWKWAGESGNVKSGGKGKAKYINSFERHVASAPAGYEFALLTICPPSVDSNCSSVDSNCACEGFVLSERANESVAVIVDRCHTYQHKGDITAVLLYHCSNYWACRGVEWLNDGMSMERDGILQYKLKYHPRIVPFFRWSP
eukprot:gnl/MRDRNA2_/MRDRNA2_177421_c0_seq1.p1 gnl/MRDRNA2_/MRDRNA2_177421_c0~~gnl/MRDRNA2_/MRDRNA2_177421_c0_seq1.p1  ORF type:complete len:351 (+),score=61.93 gnl/MRDRNA2_/MRDRNA2_177421_c0_seq1:105-1157(+)